MKSFERMSSVSHKNRAPVSKLRNISQLDSLFDTNLRSLGRTSQRKFLAQTEQSGE